MVDLYNLIVEELKTVGEKSAYVAAANEPPPRYKSYGARAKGKKKIIRAHQKAIRALEQCQQIELARLFRPS